MKSSGEQMFLNFQKTPTETRRKIFSTLSLVPIQCRLLVRYCRIDRQVKTE